MYSIELQTNMTKQHQLIHIDTLEVTMCEKINEYYVSNEEIKEGDWTLMFDDLGNLFLGNESKQYLGEKAGHHLNKGLRRVIATTNTSLQCPQVVDESQYYAEIASSKDDFVSEKSFKLGFNQHSETHSLSDEEVPLLIEWLFSQNTIGTPIPKLIEQFKSTLPTKVYYR